MEYAILREKLTQDFGYLNDTDIERNATRAHRNINSYHDSPLSIRLEKGYLQKKPRQAAKGDVRGFELSWQDDSHKWRDGVF